jgi:hypothetical protein
MHYPFHEFIRDYETIAPRLRSKKAKSFERLLIRVSKQMAERYADETESRERTKYLVLICQYVSEHMDEFDTDDFAVVGSAKVGALVSTHLLRAVHSIFTETPLSQLGHGPDTHRVKQLAATLRGSSD